MILLAEYTKIFKRTEKKYLITSQQTNELLKAIKNYMYPDAFGVSTINNIYFDTPDYRLIRASIEKPVVYKEKLRLRCYGEVNDETNTFVELKKKYKGVVYKRRVDMTYHQATDYLVNRKPPCAKTQIISEIDYFFLLYPSLAPRVALFYNRTAYYCRDASDLRITFDTAIRFRTQELDLKKGSDGEFILGEDYSIMEIKTAGSMPLWLCEELQRLSIYPTSYSKYGMCYKSLLKTGKINF